MSARIGEMAVLFQQNGVRITQIGSTETLVVFARSVSQIVVFGGLSVAMACCTLLVTALISEAVREMKPPILGAVCVGTIVGVFAILTYTLFVLSITGLVLSLFRRRIVLDMVSRRGRYLRLPGIWLEFKFSDVQAVMLCTGHSEGWRICWLCLSINNLSRFLCLHYQVRRFGTFDKVRARLEPAAEVLSRLLDCPIRAEENVRVSRLSWH